MDVAHLEYGKIKAFWLYDGCSGFVVQMGFLGSIFIIQYKIFNFDIIGI